MHDHRSSSRLDGLPSDDRIQQLLLLELVADAPPEGDTLAELTVRLGFPRDVLLEAAAALLGAGLARPIEDGVVRATPAALRFDALWPIAP